MRTTGAQSTVDDFDERSASPDSQEEITVGLSSATDLGVLVDPAGGFGSYDLAIEELGK